MSAEVEVLREATALPEPPDGSYVLVGEVPNQILFQRDDTEAADGDWGDERWFDTADGEEDPVAWDVIAAAKPQRMYLRDDLPRSAVDALDAIERVGARS